MKGEQMKRYDLEITEQRIVAIQERFVYLAHDVEREYTSRPDPEEARKAVDELVNAATCFEAAHSNPLFGDYKEESIADLQRTKAAVLRLMGVENA